MDETGKKQVMGTLGAPQPLLQLVKPGEWNDYTVFAKGGHVILRINGITMSELEDRDPKRLTRGWLALQVHTGRPCVFSLKTFTCADYET